MLPSMSYGVEAVLVRHTHLTKLYLHSLLSLCGGHPPVSHPNTLQVMWESCRGKMLI